MSIQSLFYSFQALRYTIRNKLKIKGTNKHKYREHIVNLEISPFA